MATRVSLGIKGGGTRVKKHPGEKFPAEGDVTPEPLVKISRSNKSKNGGDLYMYMGVKKRARSLMPRRGQRLEKKKRSLGGGGRKKEIIQNQEMRVNAKKRARTGLKNTAWKKKGGHKKKKKTRSGKRNTS